MLVFLKYLGLAFSALLPVVNPLGSALVFLRLVGPASPEAYRTLAIQVAARTAAFLVAIEFAGTLLLAFFGIKLPVVQLAGGFVLAAMGWNLLNQSESDTNTSARVAG